MFVRAKTIKGIKYGYLVENSWHKGKVKQTVKKYLGKIIPFPDAAISDPIISSTDNKRELLIKEVIINDLISRGATKKDEEVLSYEKTDINLNKGTIIYQEKPAVIVLNKRYVYGGLLKDLINFYEPETENDRPGQKLARAFRNAGIAIAKEDFVQLYKKIYE